MKHLQHIKSTVNQAFVDMTVRNLLNPDNKDFYIGTLDYKGLRKLLKNADAELVSVFWTAYHIAETKYNEQFKEAQKLLNNKCRELIQTTTIDTQYTHRIEQFEHIVCPECNCTSFVEGCACPNCDYVAEV